MSLAANGGLSLRFRKEPPADPFGEVVQAILERPISGRPDAAILEIQDLGPNVFYGG
jgi:hypothetical protein